MSRPSTQNATPAPAADGLPRYDRLRTYNWNYAHAPSAEDAPPLDAPAIAGQWDYVGLPVASPLAVAAGPLLNGRWCLYYAALGFDIVTYKTVRSGERACYDLPNLQPVRCGTMHGGERDIPATDDMIDRWAVSFGMPSKPPDTWQADVRATRDALPPGKVLAVSVTASPQPGWSIDDIADDFARCAAWAAEAGADCIEANLSCPNVESAEGQLYQQPADTAAVSQRIRAAIGDTPLLLKIGHITYEAIAAGLIDAVAPHADALVMVNAIAATVRDAAGDPLFAGQPRGICGEPIREASVAQVRTFARLIRERNAPLRLIGVGGIATADHVRAYLDAGAPAVQIATAAMLDPMCAGKIRTAMARE